MIFFLRLQSSFVVKIYLDGVKIKAFQQTKLLRYIPEILVLNTIFFRENTLVKNCFILETFAGETETVIFPTTSFRDFCKSKHCVHFLLFGNLKC